MHPFTVLRNLCDITSPPPPPSHLLWPTPEAEGYPVLVDTGGFNIGVRVAVCRHVGHLAPARGARNFRRSRRRAVLGFETIVFGRSLDILSTPPDYRPRV